jgi:ribose/xylose/arabinose/galactoside ABC-type transport system permease subunit
MEELPAMAPIGKLLITIGLVIVAAGLLLMLSDKVPWLGKLPGDITVKRDNFTFYFPLATCVLISVIVSLVLWLLRK